MGFIRGAVIVLFSFVLFVSLVFMNLSLALSLSLQHDNLKPVLESSADAFLGDTLDNVDFFGTEEIGYMQQYCLENADFEISYENFNFAIPCEVIFKGKDYTTNYLKENIVDEIYYAEYNCEFWDCVRDSSIPFVIFSEKAMDYWRGKFFLFLALTVMVFSLTLLISQNRPVTFIVTGVSIIFSALPFSRLRWLSRFVPNEFSELFSLFFSKAHLVFIIMLIVGIVFIVFGVLFKLFGWSMDFMRWLSKKPEEGKISKSDVRDIVKEEISKKNLPKKNKPDSKTKKKSLSKIL